MFTITPDGPGTADPAFDRFLNEATTYTNGATSSGPIPTTLLATVLDEVVAQVQTYIECSEDQALALALWAAYTHCIHEKDDPPFDVVPYLFVSSPEKQSGKTTLMNVIKPIAARPDAIAGSSLAALLRGLGNRPTLLFDEVDTVFGPDAPKNESNEIMRSVLNSGFSVVGAHKRYNAVARHEEYLPTFGPKALFGIGKSIPDTVMDRSIHIVLKRRTATTGGKRARLARLQQEGSDLAARLAATVNPLALRHFDDDEFPPELSDRSCDIWEPLLALAEQAGGSWTSEARRIAVSLSADNVNDTLSLGTELLRDIRTVFIEENWAADFVLTKDVIGNPATAGFAMSAGIEATGLCAVEEGPWATFSHGKPITPHRLWDILRTYGVKPVHQSAGNGMRRSDLRDVFRRYLPPLP